MFEYNKEKVKTYTEATDYGISCKFRELSDVIDNVKKFMKKNKVRGDGLNHYFAVSENGDPETGETCFSEWKLGYSMKRPGHFGSDRGKMWELVLRPNRHAHIQKDGERRDTWVAPDHKEFDFIIELRRFDSFRIEDGKRVESDTAEEKEERDKFFDALLSSVGFELVPLYEYEAEEMTCGCRECGTWQLDPEKPKKLVPYRREN